MICLSKDCCHDEDTAWCGSNRWGRDEIDRDIEYANCTACFREIEDFYLKMLQRRKIVGY